MSAAKPSDGHGDSRPAGRDGGPQTDRDDDLIDAPFADDAERAESEWLLARAKDPAAPAPSPAIAREYAELEDHLEGLPAGDADESWHEEVLRQAAAQTTAQGSGSAPAVAVEPIAPATTANRRPRPSRTRRWVAAGALAAGAAAAVVMAAMMRRPRSSLPAGELEVKVHRGEQVRGDGTAAAVGDHWLVRARPLGTGEVRVYRADGPLVERCPASPKCTTSADGTFTLDVFLDAPVTYYALLVDKLTGNLPDGEMAEYRRAAQAAGARIQTQQIEVR